MQPYYEIKLKCFILRLMMGCGILLAGGSILISIVREMMSSYDGDSRYAYVLGLLICVLMLGLGAFLVYQAFHFEQLVFGRRKQDYALLKKDMEAAQVVSAGNLVVTDQFALLFSMHLFNMCQVIRAEDIIACFENPVYGTVAKPTEYTIYIYDRDFKCHTIVLKARKAEDGHRAKEKICREQPWIFSDNRDAFLDMMMTKAGRRNALNKIEKIRYQMKSTVNVEAEAETELNQIASEAREKLNFHSILGKRSAKKDNKEQKKDAGKEQRKEQGKEAKEQQEVPRKEQKKKK